MKKKLPQPIKAKLSELKAHLTKNQIEKLRVNLEGIIKTMASGFGIKKGTADYNVYKYQLAVKYICYQYNELQKSLKSKYDRNCVPVRAITPKELFGWLQNQ